MHTESTHTPLPHPTTASTGPHSAHAPITTGVGRRDFPAISSMAASSS